jgi:ABC-type spermidine/putrescine transport system permease subunit I
LKGDQHGRRPHHCKSRIRPKDFGRTVVVLTGFHCIGNYTVQEVLMKNRTRVLRNIYNTSVIKIHQEPGTGPQSLLIFVVVVVVVVVVVFVVRGRRSLKKS